MRKRFRRAAEYTRIYYNYTIILYFYTNSMDICHMPYKYIGNGNMARNSYNIIYIVIESGRHRSAFKPFTICSNFLPQTFDVAREFDYVGWAECWARILAGLFQIKIDLLWTAIYLDQRDEDAMGEGEIDWKLQTKR